MTEILNLSYLRSIYLDAPAELQTLIQDTVTTTSALIDGIERMSEGGSEKTVDLAHELKGMCRMTGAHELAELGEEVESLAQQMKYAEVSARIEALRTAHRRFVEAAQQLRTF